MKCRRLSLLVVLYVSLDLTNPFMPGAFNFDESVEGVSIQREGAGVQPSSSVPAPVPARPEPGQVNRAAPAPPGIRALAGWFVDLRQAHAAASDPQSATEDH